MTQQVKISCSNCGETLDPSWAQIKDRPPCPTCGRKGVSLAISIVEEINIAGSISVGMEPAHTRRTWQQRWHELKLDHTQLNALHDETMSGIAINAAHHRLQSFFIHAYHLKDALIKDQSIGLEKSVIEGTITNSPILSLLADLANLDKHSQLDRKPRSGSIPTILSVKGHLPSHGDGWRLCVNISHNEVILDGIDIANNVMNEWRTRLESWNLI